MKITDIELCKIRTEKRLWEVDESKIKPLAESIKTFGLINPISVLEDGDNYVLIAGEHRLLAYVYNEEISIPTIIHKRQYENIELDKARCLIMEADENLLRRTPDGHEEAYLLYRRKEAYELLFPTPSSEKIKKLKKDINYRVENGLPYDEMEKELNDLENHKSFIEDTVEKTGLSSSSISAKVRIGKVIDKETGEIADDLKVSNRILTKITVGDEEEARVASKIHIDTIKSIDDKFEKTSVRNAFIEKSLDKFKKEMEQQQPKCNIEQPIEFAKSFKNKIENEYLPEYENYKNDKLFDTSMLVSNEDNITAVNEEKLYLEKSDNLFFCTTSYLLKHSENLNFTKGFINLYIDNEKQFTKVTKIINLCDDEDKIMVECSTDEIFTKYLNNIYNSEE